MDAIAMLEKEHQEAKKVMEEISAAAAPQKQTLFAALKLALEKHDRIEETIFYPAVKANPKASGFGPADQRAHEKVESALEHLSQLSTENPQWTTDFNAMRDTLLKHVADEETNLFVKIRSMLSPMELNQLGEQMLAKKELQLKAA